jgi:hypothetical protein
MVPDRLWFFHKVETELVQHRWVRLPDPSTVQGLIATGALQEVPELIQEAIDASYM